MTQNTTTTPNHTKQIKTIHNSDKTLLILVQEDCIIIMIVKNYVKLADRNIRFSIGYDRQDKSNSIYSNKSYFNKQLKCNGSQTVQSVPRSRTEK